jgi:hypothetical protein
LYPSASLSLYLRAREDPEQVDLHYVKSRAQKQLARLPLCAR